MTVGRRSALWRFLVALAIAAPLGGCEGESQGARADAPASAVATPAFRPAIRVRVAEIRRGVVAPPTAVGVASAFQSARVAAEVPGRVLRRVVEPGDPVERDAPLVVLDASRLQLAVDQARAQREARAVDLADARRELRRGRELIRKRAISQRELDELETAVKRADAALRAAEVALARAERALADATVRAPFGGTVEEVLVDVGEYLQPGTPVATVVDFSRVRVRAGVTAAEAADLEVGQPAEISFETLGGAAARGVVHSIGRVADPGTGTYPVELWIEDPDPRLREGMVGRVRFARREAEERPVAPHDALIRRDGKPAVFVVVEGEDGPRAELRPVRTGRSDDHAIEILDGVAVGERVVIDGQFALRDGAPVTVDQAATSS